MESAERLLVPEEPISERLLTRTPALFELGAWYYDPRSSQPIAARIIVLEGGRVLVSGAGVDVECNATELRISAPMLGATLDAVVLPSGGQCELYAKEAVDRLRRLGGARVPFGRIYRWERSWPLSLVATASVLLAIVVGYVWAIPSAAERLAAAWPALAQRIGRGALGLLDASFEPTRLEAREQQRLQALFARVAADFPGVPLELELRRAGVANAFALPGGTVVLTDELVQLSGHDAELEGVLFHEIGHIVHGHGLRRAVESSLFGVVAMAYYGDADRVTALASGLPIAYAQSRYSRAEEAEADGVALAGLLRHGREPGHYAEILRLLERESGAARPELRYFSSHPATDERIERFEPATSTR